MKWLVETEMLQPGDDNDDDDDKR